MKEEKCQGVESGGCTVRDYWNEPKICSGCGELHREDYDTCATCTADESDEHVSITRDVRGLQDALSEETP